MEPAGRFAAESGVTVAVGGIVLGLWKADLMSNHVAEWASVGLLIVLGLSFRRFDRDGNRANCVKCQKRLDTRAAAFMGSSLGTVYLHYRCLSPLDWIRLEEIKRSEGRWEYWKWRWRVWREPDAPKKEGLEKVLPPTSMDSP